MNIPRRGPFARAVLAAVALALVAVAPARAVTIDRVVSPGGIEAWLVEDRTIPVIAVEIAFRGGAALDPAGKEGLAGMVSGLLDEGAGELDSQAFQERLNDLAISLGFDAGLDIFIGSLKTLSENRDQAFELLRLALTVPRFDPEAVERIRSQISAYLERQAEDPGHIAARTWWEAAFPGHPYGRPVSGTTNSVVAITAEDLHAFAARRLARDRLVIAVVGDISADELAPLLDATFGGLPEVAAPAEVAEAAPETTGAVTVVPRDIPQSVVVFGQAGLKRDDPDWYGAYVVNYVLGGGGFSSRVYAELREKRGLAYSVYSYLNPLDHAGLILGGIGTRNDQARESLDLIRAEWRRMREAGPTAQELADAKAFLTGSFPLRLDSTDRIAGILVSIQLDDLGIDYLDRRAALIEAVSLEDVRRIAKRLLDPDALTFVVVGQPDAAGAPPGGGS